MITRLITAGLILIGLVSLAFGVYGWRTEPPWPPPRASIVEPERELADVFAGGLIRLAGRLEVGTHGLIVEHGSSVVGSCVIAGSVTNRGMIGFADNIGRLAITRDYTQTNTASLVIKILQIGDNTFSDLLDVVGGVTLNGGGLSILATPWFIPEPGKEFVLIKTTIGNCIGAFGGVFTPLVPVAVLYFQQEVRVMAYV